MNKEINTIVSGQKAYKEVKLDGSGFDKYYRNPLTQTFQYEYALYEAVSDLFSEVKRRSMCVDSLKLYFRELPHTTEPSAEVNKGLPEEEKKKKTQEDLHAEMTMMVARDFVGNITFPMMHICQAEARIATEKDGTHTLIFSDGIYGFSVHLDMPRKGHPRKIEVHDLNSVHPVDGHTGEAALERAA